MFLQLLLASSRITVINNKIDPGGVGPLNSIFAYQFKCITRMKLSFFFKLLPLALIQPFNERNAITRAEFTIWPSARGPALG